MRFQTALKKHGKYLQYIFCEIAQVQYTCFTALNSFSISQKRLAIKTEATLSFVVVELLLFLICAVRILI